MDKHSVNLLIKRKSDSNIIIKLRTILPVTAIVSLSFFVISFFVSLIYINNNNKEFKSLKSQGASFEKQISDKKNVEGLYTLTVLRLITIDQLNSGSNNYAKLLFEILKLQSEGISFTQTFVDKKNVVNISLVASSSATLDDFITKLIAVDASKQFSEMKSSGIVRDKTGGYLLTISMKPSNNLLQ